MISRLGVVVTLVLLAPLMIAAKCEEGSGGGGRKQACDLRETQPPKWIAGRGKGTIEAAVTAYCDPAPKRHTLTLWLEREASDGKTWLQVGQTSVFQKATDIPPPPPGRKYTISTGCIDGNWRVRAWAEGLSPDGTPFRFSLPAKESLIRVVRCRLQ
ncbi:hypothetical protein Drose_32285 [Dactylosporangium roseum]|uniref:Secreted protein n=1 Tax=Dactylosporangium roseum TaxID=47989 RepID=A0ABY5Z134_9ACTN|nr:hypothetical protein [Dactylosporangium roseum]UWZ35735.1 hypothetical protein Drose_32285 [Dactylosporangium roseum]